jgi:hypothetical protein
LGVRDRVGGGVEARDRVRFRAYAHRPFRPRDLLRSLLGVLGRSRLGSGGRLRAGVRATVRARVRVRVRATARATARTRTRARARARARARVRARVRVSQGAHRCGIHLHRRPRRRPPRVASPRELREFEAVEQPAALGTDHEEVERDRRHHRHGDREQGRYWVE